MGSKKNVSNYETLSVVKYFLAEMKIHVRSSRLKFGFWHCKIDDIDGGAQIYKSSSKAYG